MSSNWIECHLFMTKTLPDVPNPETKSVEDLCYAFKMRSEAICACQIREFESSEMERGIEGMAQPCGRQCQGF
jgi:hypothetical protein